MLKYKKYLSNNNKFIFYLIRIFENNFTKIAKVLFYMK